MPTTYKEKTPEENSREGIIIEELSMHFEKVPVLQNVSAQLQCGALHTILGPNGAGKSSLLGAIAGDRKPDSGRIQLLNQYQADWPARKLAQQLAVLPQHSRLDFPFRVREVVELGRLPHDSDRVENKSIVERVLRELDIIELAEKLYTHLSGGERQRVQLARVLAQVTQAEENTAGILLLDEPSTALDIRHQQQLFQLLRSRLHSNFCIVTVLHDFNLAARYADKLLILNDGRAVAAGTPWQVLTPVLMKTVFGIDAHILPHPDTHTPMVIPC